MLIFWEDVLFCYVLDYASEKFLWLTNKEKKKTSIFFVDI